jgi:hypothetical protein
MKPVLFACWFQEPRDRAWPRLARVLEHSAEQHCQGWDRRIRLILPPHRRPGQGVGYVANTVKLEFWASTVDAMPDDARVALLDADTFIVNSLDAVWATPFDVAITERPQGSIYPFNAGVVFVRANERSRAFMRAWAAANRRMLTDPAVHRVYQKRFGGMNQAALGALLDEGILERLGLTMAALPCAEWNCEDLTWHTFDPATTRIVHLKAGLRYAALEDLEADPSLRALALRWREAEAASLRVTA